MSREVPAEVIARVRDLARASAEARNTYWRIYPRVAAYQVLFAAGVGAEQAVRIVREIFDGHSSVAAGN